MTMRSIDTVYPRKGRDCDCTIGMDAMRHQQVCVRDALRGASFDQFRTIPDFDAWFDRKQQILREVDDSIRFVREVTDRVKNRQPVAA